MSYFTNSITYERYVTNYSDPFRHAGRLISPSPAEHRRQLRQGSFPTHNAELRRQLRQGSFPTDNVFDPRLGPIGSGRPRPSITGRDFAHPAMRHVPASNLRPDDRGMDTATCLEPYRPSTASGEQEPPITTNAAGSREQQAPITTTAASTSTPAQEELEEERSTRTRLIDWLDNLPSPRSAVEERRRAVAERRSNLRAMARNAGQDREYWEML